MSAILRADGYLLARPQDGGWYGEWCVGRRGPDQQWRFGAQAGALAPPRASSAEDNTYFEELGAPRPRGCEPAVDQLWRHLQTFAPTPDGALDVLVNSGLDGEALAHLTGVLQTIGHTPRYLLPRALVAARRLQSGHHQVLDLGRSQGVMSHIEVEADRVCLKRVETISQFGFYPMYTQWFEQAAEVFATEHRFDIHRNLVANREQLFAQLCQAFKGSAPVDRIELTLDERHISLPWNELAVQWPEAIERLRGAEKLKLLTPLNQILPLPEQALDLGLLADPTPAEVAALCQQLPTDSPASRYQELPRE